MQVLADTNVLLRLFDRNDPHYLIVRRAVAAIRARGDSIVIAPQTVAELWNVSTRPATARGGFGLTVTETDRRVRVLERAFVVLAEVGTVYLKWRELVIKYQVQGLNAHDARLVAFKIAHGIQQMLTLNVQDFRRYSETKLLSPDDFNNVDR